MHPANVWLSRFAKLAVAATFGLIFLGGLVTTKDAGMSVPDWPTTFRYSMFTVPFAKWLGEDALQSGVFYEHSHRLLASFVGLLTTVLAVWIWKTEQHRWLQKLARGAFFLVVTQGVFGGLRVLLEHWHVDMVNTSVGRLFAMLHACTAQAFLCVLVFIAAALSPRWKALEQPAATTRKTLSAVRWTSWLLVAVIYAQLVLGAIMRHLKAGLAIPTFPRSGLNGEWLPPYWNEGVGFHFAHRIGALVVTLIFATLAALLFARARRERRLILPASWLAVLILAQITLGADIILKLRPPTLTTLHVVNGAAVLATALLLAVRATRLRAPAVFDAAVVREPAAFQKISA